MVRARVRGWVLRGLRAAQRGFEHVLAIRHGVDASLANAGAGPVAGTDRADTTAGT